ncbi:MAG: helix-turn-helix transcriptional regulator [Firmicutes bacterium]|nr:helix-turn-helix transcriptional regulator [Bacillota bacterium]
MKVVNYVREIRMQRGITQVQMAKDLQITRQTINAIESHKYNPSLELALKMLVYFDVSIDQLFRLEGTGGESK